MPGHTQLKFLKSISYFLKYLSTYQISGRPFKSQLAFTCSKSKIETLQVVKPISLVGSILGYNLSIKIFLVMGFAQTITALFQFNFSSCPEKANDKTYHNLSRTDHGQRKKWLKIFIFTFLCDAPKGFMKALKAFINPFEEPQRSVKIKI